MTENLSPATQALAYRIWAHCQPIGWNCTIPEIADALGADRHRVNWVLRAKGWSGRVRASVRWHTEQRNYTSAKFDQADALLGKSDFDAPVFMEAEE